MMMTSEQASFWKPYIDLIGPENFSIIKSDDGSVDIVHSKHYCGFDTSGFGPYGEQNRNVAIARFNGYQEILSKDRLTADDIDRIFRSYVEKAYFDTELVFLLTEHGAELSLDEHWELVIECWCRQEFTTEGGRGDNWRKILNHREKPSYLTDQLPDRFIAYRAGEETGFSWTLEKKVADRFHKRFEKQFGDIPMLKREFTKSDVVFYTNRRNEQEVVILSSV